MDRKAIIVVAASVLLLVLWFPLVNKLYPPKPLPGPVEKYAGTNPPATNLPSTNAPAVKPPPVATNGTPVTVVATPAAPEQTVVLTNEWARYTFTSHGGGLRRVELIGYSAEIACRKEDSEKQKAAGYASLNAQAPLPALTLIGAAELLDAQPFALTVTTNGLRAEKSLANGLRLVHEFALGTNHLLTATARLENTAATPIAIGAHEWVLGTATPLGLRDDGLLVGLMESDGHKSQPVDQAWFANRTLG